MRSLQSFLNVQVLRHIICLEIFPVGASLAGDRACENVARGSPYGAIAAPGDNTVLYPTTTPPCSTGRHHCCPWLEAPSS